MEHYARDCPDNFEDYALVCGNCKQLGHTIGQCNAPFNFNNRDQWIQNSNSKEDQNRAQPESPVNCIEVVCAVQTRGQRINFKGDNTKDTTGTVKTNTQSTEKPVPSKPISILPRITSSSAVQPELGSKEIPIAIDIANRKPIQYKPVPQGVKDQLVRRKRALGITSNMEPYDIMKDLDLIQPTITMKQLLAVAPECRSTLTSSLVRRRQRNREIHEVSLNPDPGAPTIDVTIDGVLVPGVQVDGGSSVNLMTVDTMEQLGLTGLVPTELMLRMADHSKVNPMGILVAIETIIAGIVYHIDYVVFQLKSSILSYPILLGRPWLFHAKARNDWGRGTLTIGKRRNKIVLQMYPVPYNGESQIPRTEFTFDIDSDDEDDASYGDQFIDTAPVQDK